MLTRDRAKGETAWVLEKLGTALKPISAKREDQSAVTGRTIAQIAEARDAVWHNNRTSVPAVDLDQLPRSRMTFVELMLAKPVPQLPEGANWQYELLCGRPHKISYVVQSVMWLPKTEAVFTAPQLAKIHNII
jgi:hypothetical protein